MMNEILNNDFMFYCEQSIYREVGRARKKLEKGKYRKIPVI